MKQVIAIVRPYLAERVIENLRLAPLEAISVREVKGFGRQKNYLDNYGDSEYGLAFLPKVEITLWVEDQRVEEGDQARGRCVPKRTHGGWKDHCHAGSWML